MKANATRLHDSLVTLIHSACEQEGLDCDEVNRMVAEGKPPCVKLRMQVGLPEKEGKGGGKDGGEASRAELLEATFMIFITADERSSSISHKSPSRKEMGNPRVRSLNAKAVIEAMGGELTYSPPTEAAIDPHHMYITRPSLVCSVSSHHHCPTVCNTPPPPPPPRVCECKPPPPRA